MDILADGCVLRDACKLKEDPGFGKWTSISPYYIGGSNNRQGMVIVQLLHLRWLNSERRANIDIYSS